MTAPWWPPAAPVAPHWIGELTSRELGILTRFAESGPADGTDPTRLAEFVESLRTEATERRQFAAQFTANAKAGRFGPL